MNVTALATALPTNAAATVQGQASLLVLKKAMELQQSTAAQLLETLPQSAGPTPGAVVGGKIDTFA